MHCWDHGHVRPGEDAEGDVDHLEVLGPGGGGDLARPGPEKRQKNETSLHEGP